ncbi:MAG: nitroreductase family protein [Tannerellaceae bacterium]
MDSIFQTRRSIRKYSKKEISDELLREIIADASRCSTTGNMQLYSVVVTRREEGKSALSPLHFNQPMIKGAPVVLTVCADYNRFASWCEQRNADPGCFNFHSFLVAAMDALLFAQTLCMAAESRDLGICYIGTTTYTVDKIIELLKLPRLVVPLATITLGYPEVVPQQPDRLAIDAIMHNEVYADYTVADIDRIYKEKEELDENIRFVAENNKTTLAQVYSEIRYTKEANDRVSQLLEKVLKLQGYL